MGSGTPQKHKRTQPAEEALKMAKRLNFLGKEFLIKICKSNQRVKLSGFYRANGAAPQTMKKGMSQYEEGGA